MHNTYSCGIASTFITDWYSRTEKSLICFDVSWSSDVCMEIDGAPFYVIERQVLAYASGCDAHAKANESTAHVCITMLPLNI